MWRVRFKLDPAVQIVDPTESVSTNQAPPRVIL
jgi:hypothetical protein